MVNASALELAARRLRLGEYLRLGAGKKKRVGGKNPPCLRMHSRL